MKKTLKEIASLVGGEVVGDESIEIGNVSGIEDAQAGDITFLANSQYRPLLKLTKASAVITPQDIESADKPIIRSANPSLSFSKVISIFRPEEEKTFNGIDKTAIIGQGVSMGKDVSVGPYVVIEKNCCIADAVTVYPHVYLGYNTTIGPNSKIYPNVTIRENSIIGSRVIIHSNTMIGSDGFGFVKVDGVHQKIPQAGIVEVEDDVEIGSNVSIDRARFGKTLIQKGTKIDNLVQIAHNVKIGANSIIVAQTGISGSTKIGDNVIIAGQVGIVGHLEIGDNVIIGAQSGVSKSIPAGSVVLGSPPNPIPEERKILACRRRLPELFKTVKELKDKLKRGR